MNNTITKPKIAPFIQIPKEFKQIRKKMTRTALILQDHIFDILKSNKWSDGIGLFFVSELAREIEVSTNSIRDALTECESKNIFYVHNLGVKGKLILLVTDKNKVIYEKLKNQEVSADIGRFFRVDFTRGNIDSGKTIFRTQFKMTGINKENFGDEIEKFLPKEDEKNIINPQPKVTLSSRKLNTNVNSTSLNSESELISTINPESSDPQAGLRVDQPKTIEKTSNSGGCIEIYTEKLYKETIQKNTESEDLPIDGLEKISLPEIKNDSLTVEFLKNNFGFGKEPNLKPESLQKKETALVTDVEKLKKMLKNIKIDLPGVKNEPISDFKINELVTKYPERIEAQIKALPYRNIKSSVAGILIKSIESNAELPAEMLKIERKKELEKVSAKYEPVLKIWEPFNDHKNTSEKTARFILTQKIFSNLKKFRSDSSNVNFVHNLVKTSKLLPLNECFDNVSPEVLEELKEISNSFEFVA